MKLRNATLAAIGLVAIAGCSQNLDALAERQSAVASAGATVMPFDLNATTHFFTDTDFGGVQTVNANSPSDTGNINLIREHLAEEASKFRAGDFSDPAAVHGDSMPGLPVLRQRHADVSIKVTNTASGATLTYRASAPAVVGALHEWFGAQRMDHGSHAMNMN
ncbi:MAG: hypothetical protein WBZ04_11215 [Candidatus Nanopelagicales bacterium]|mgnify:CR=1 FL=1|jgi:hypothetical protein|nr:hypothetical protein [Actinomycetota bacterium]